MERIAMFLDAANLEHGFRNLGAQIDYLGLRDYLAEGRLLIETFVYLPINPSRPDSKAQFIGFLQDSGFFVRSKVGKPRPNDKWKCNFDVEMAVDILHYAQHGRVDIIVIGSGDADMAPVCKEVRWCGVRCEVAATRECTAKELLTAASGYIDLNMIIHQQQEELLCDGSGTGNRNVSEAQEPSSSS